MTGNDDLMARAVEMTHRDGELHPAPLWAHRLLDLGFGGWKVLPSGGLHMWQWSVPGSVYSVSGEYSRVTHTVDFREDKGGVWTTTLQQEQPNPIPPLQMTLEEWLARKAAGERVG